MATESDLCFRAMPLDKSSDAISCLLRADAELYPCGSPCTVETVRSWYQNPGNEEFAQVFERNGTMVGMCVVIPLSRKGWEELISGVRSEAEIDGTCSFSADRDKEVGLHLYHLEKNDPSIKDFFRAHCLPALSAVVKKLGSPQVIGFSGLCVTQASITIFSDKLNCTEEESYDAEEHILNARGEVARQVITGEQLRKEFGDEWATSEAFQSKYEHQARCQMLVTRRGANSLVWNFL
mmetsp:Transcript_51985/g.105906  ORF Transcript_51985/g.105906 Transcript_51985/m.105906 type:complete len:237 (-) Transcript_51985:19-729(-)